MPSFIDATSRLCCFSIFLSSADAEKASAYVCAIDYKAKSCNQQFSFLIFAIRLIQRDVERHQRMDSVHVFSIFYYS